APASEEWRGLTIDLRQQVGTFAPGNRRRASGSCHQVNMSTGSCRPFAEAVLGDEEGCHGLGSRIEWAALPRGHVHRLRTGSSTSLVAGRSKMALGIGGSRLLRSWTSRE